jgi:diaminohydroxyphosphoribosylaminopyrimidine deaminase/5-amino-6-(5-phosphoribosylamino)uracil reductase
MMPASEDHKWMSRAIELAWLGLYTTHPNPRVGCVLVAEIDGENQIIGEGYHHRAGQPHAEINALADVKKHFGDNAEAVLQTATAYVTLEPCSHYGRTPPCSEALIKAKVNRVVAAMQDPNPQVAGAGLAMLSAAGIDVESGIMEEQARELNPGFIKRMESCMPWVRSKQAMSLDGRTAMASGESKWITGPDARSDVQRLRARSSVIITGIGSIQHDDSALTVRADELSLPEDIAQDIVTNQPLRVVVDSQLKISSDAKILSQPGRTIVVCLDTDANHQTATKLSFNENIWFAPVTELGKIDLTWLLKTLANKEQVNEVLVEAGAILCGAFTDADLIDEYWLYVAPKFMGSSARSLLDLPLSEMAQSKSLLFKQVSQVGQDLRIVAVPVAVTDKD